MHWNWSIWLKHVPPFWHGLLLHSSMSEKRRRRKWKNCMKISIKLSQIIVATYHCIEEDLENLEGISCEGWWLKKYTAHVKCIFGNCHQHKRQKTESHCVSKSIQKWTCASGKRAASSYRVVHKYASIFDVAFCVEKIALHFCLQAFS